MRLSVVISIVLCWIFSFVNLSGWGMLMGTPEKMCWIIFIWTLYLMGIKGRRFLPKFGGFHLLGILLFFILIPFIVSGKFDGALYLVSFLTIFCFSNINISEKELSVSSWIIGGLGLGLITIYARTEILSGWNDNGIAMQCLFSFIYFSVYFNTASKRWQRFLSWSIALIYAMMIAGTESRGALLFMLVMVFLMFAKNLVVDYICNPKIRFVILQIPLVVAVGAVWIANQSWFPEFDTWYKMNYNKPLFNGREILWLEAFENMLDYPFGRGEFVINYHNSAVACIGVFGVLGYWCWIKFFKKQLDVLTDYFDDYTVYAFTCAFIIIYIQQATELGFLIFYPNMLPYMMLGLALGRVRWYETEIEESYEES